MFPATQTSTNALLEKIAELAKKTVEAKAFAVFKEFLKIYYSRLSYEDLASKTTENLAGMCLGHWKLLQVKAARPEVEVFNPDLKKDGWQTKHTVVQVVASDMPFLVDSVLMVMNRLGVTVHFLIHLGGIVIERDSAGHIILVQPNTGQVKPSAAYIEAPIYLEIDRQADAEKLQEIKRQIAHALADVKIVVEDWQPMRKKLHEIVERLKAQTALLEKTDVLESIAFLEWMEANHFTFLGYREYEVVGKGNDIALKLVSGSGLGVLRDESQSKKLRYYRDLHKPAHDMVLSIEHNLILSKTNTTSTVHRPIYTDYVGVKLRNEKMELVGELRFIGLYTSTAYSEDPLRIPLVREKVEGVLRRSGFSLSSHAGKDLQHILATFPRDDLFHTNLDQLYNIAIGILQLQERRVTRLFVREDEYGHYVSCLVYLPKENFSTDLAETIRKILSETFHAKEVIIGTYVSGPVLARIHYVVRLAMPPRAVDYPALEQRIAQAGRSWGDIFKETLAARFSDGESGRLYQKYKNAFPAGYRETYTAEIALNDIQEMEELHEQQKLRMRFETTDKLEKNRMDLRLYSLDASIALSSIVPLLENMGLRVLSEQPYKIKLSESRRIWVHNLEVEYIREPQFPIDSVRSIFQEAFYAVFRGIAENDGFNALILCAQLNWREITVLRAYARYFQQIGFVFSQKYLEQTLMKNISITQKLAQLFVTRFLPYEKPDCDQCGALKEAILQALDLVKVLDEDRILRKYLAVIEATQRTNYYQENTAAEKNYLCFKLKPALIPDMPLPLPEYEIFVYSPRVEGVHLRMAKVARGGLRWSDRPEDFRTEVLGLMKAQQVKNAVIVPAGAKGGFFPKWLPVEKGRDAVQQEGIACYQIFISALLDLTDNIVDGKIVPPKNTVRYDEDDPYLVVAADKGTATFSDIANKISVDHGFWLGDGFASGGATGYDHKKMGITAKGAWISVQRHFQEMGIAVDNTDITVVGIGDMSGDVFGNGLLSSKHMKLVAAFNHMHIFIDPNPDPQKSYVERLRLFQLPRSTWMDYDAKLISEGGGIYERSAKTIQLSEPARLALGLDKNAFEPTELIHHILKAPVDLLWNGGIGTYVKSAQEQNLEVGDRANDGLRVNGKDLRARVVGEGGNLGFTQRGRIEYALNGGRINTDFIDNSAGVDCSDHEVNLKIFLNRLVARKAFTEKQRNDLLAMMTNEVGELVLADNDQQNLILGVAAFEAPKQMGLLRRMISDLESAGKLNRELEFIPSDEALLDRSTRGQGLTHPELSILLSYGKIVLKEELIPLNLVKDPYFSDYIYRAFPKVIQEKFGASVKEHPLANELIATQVANAIIADMGLTFMYRIQEETNAPVVEIVRAYVASVHILKLHSLIDAIRAFDFKINAEVQYEMLSEASRVVRRTILWFLRNWLGKLDIEKAISFFEKPVGDLFARLAKLISGRDRARIEEKRSALLSSGVTVELADRIANGRPIYQAFNIIEIAARCEQELHHVAKIYFLLAERLDLLWFREQLSNHPVSNRWSVLAKAGLQADLDFVQRELTYKVLTEANAKSAVGQVNAWMQAHQDPITRCEMLMADFRSAPTKDFDILTVAIRELMALVK